MPTVGELAPLLRLRDQNGSWFDLSTLRGDAVAVVFFYPRDFTGGCTMESCAFRDAYEDFVDAGATVIGVSSDSVGTHRRFANAFRLPFTLLADDGGRARKAWDVPKSLGFLPGRVTYIVDTSGKVVHVFNSQLNAVAHIREALAVVRQLAGSAERGHHEQNHQRDGDEQQHYHSPDSHRQVTT